MATLGQAYVQIIPSAEGIAGNIESVLKPEAAGAGKSAGKSIASNIGSTMQSAGGLMTKGFTVPLAAVGGLAMKSFSDVHGGLETIIQKTGASGDALTEMQGIMNDLAGSIPTDFSTIGAAVGEVNTRFGVTGEELEKLSSQFLKFADLNGTDVSSSVDAVQSAMAAFGLQTSDTGAFLDTLNKAGQDTGVSVDQLAQNLKTNAASLREMGYNASDATAFLAQLDKNGIDVSTVMTGMRKAFTEATKDGKSMSEAMGELQTAFQSADTDTAAYQDALELFGTRAGPAIAKAVEDGRLSFDALGTSIEDNIGNVSSTFDETITPMDQMTTKLNDLKIKGAELAVQLMTALAPAIEKITNVVQNIMDKWDQLDPKTKDAIVKIGMIVAVVGPLIGIIAAVAGAITMIMSPVGLVVAAIAALIVIGVLLYQNWDKIKAKATEIWNGIKEYISNACKEMKEGLQRDWETIKTAVIQAWEKLKTKATTVWNSIKSAVMRSVNGVKTSVTTTWSSIKSKLQSVWDSLKSKATTVWNNIKTAVSNPVKTLKSTLSTTWDSIKTKAKTAWDKVKEAITKPIEQAKGTLQGIVNKISGLFPINIGNIANIRIPHISVSGGTPPYGIAGAGTPPSFHVTWAAKGMILDGATLIGAGEAGREGIIPLEGRYMRPFAKTIADEMPGGGQNNITINVTVNGAENPEMWGQRLARELQMQMRTA